jgi:hypothetical protein
MEEGKGERRGGGGEGEELPVQEDAVSPRRGSRVPGKKINLDRALVIDGQRQRKKSVRVKIYGFVAAFREDRGFHLPLEEVHDDGFVSEEVYLFKKKLKNVGNEENFAFFCIHCTSTKFGIPKEKSLRTRKMKFLQKNLHPYLPILKSSKKSETEKFRTFQNSSASSASGCPR